MELYELSAWRIAQGIEEKKFSAVEVAQSCAARMEALEPVLGACITITPERAIESARRVDDMVARDQEVGLLCGVPVVVKDVLCTEGVRTTCGSRILENWCPPYDATIVRLMEENGAGVIGKSNMDEFAMGSSTETSAFHKTKNPRCLSCVPGGSSGGSAAAVAAGYAPLAIGTDTGGSIRQPAAFCGVQGLKPSYGMVSRYGLVAYASSLDQAGPMAREVGDLALMMDVIADEYDPLDSTSYRGERHRFLSAIRGTDLKGRKIGLLTGYDESCVDESTREAVSRAAQICAAAGAKVCPVSLPIAMKYGISCYYIIAPAEASSNLARYDGVRYGMSADAESLEALYAKTRACGFGEEVKRRILTGTYVLSSGYYDAFYVKAQAARVHIGCEFDSVFSGVDAILAPTAPTKAFKFGHHSSSAAMYLEDIFTVPVNLAGLPALSLYAGMTEGLPDSVQVIGPRYSDHSLLRIGAVLEREFGTPPVACCGGAVL